MGSCQLLPFYSKCCLQLLLSTRSTKFYRFDSLDSLRFVPRLYRDAHTPHYSHHNFPQSNVHSRPRHCLTRLATSPRHAQLRVALLVRSSRVVFCPSRTTCSPVLVAASAAANLLLPPGPYLFSRKAASAALSAAFSVAFVAGLFLHPGRPPPRYVAAATAMAAEDGAMHARGRARHARSAPAVPATLATPAQPASQESDLWSQDVSQYEPNVGRTTFGHFSKI